MDEEEEEKFWGERMEKKREKFRKKILFTLNINWILGIAESVSIVECKERETIWKVEKLNFSSLSS